MKHTTFRSIRWTPYLLFGGIFLLLGAGLLFAWLPDTPDDGLTLARSAYSQLTDVPHTKACRLEYTVRTRMIVDGEVIESPADITYLANNHRLHWVSDRIRIYQDTAVAINILTAEKTIYIAPSSPRELRERQASTAAMIRDSLFAEGEVLEYTITDGDESPGSNKKLVIRPADNLRRFTMVDTVSLYLSDKERSLQRIHLRYLPNTGIHSVEVEYHKFEVVGHIEELGLPVINFVFAADGSLLAEYEGYQLVDMRDGMRR